jgi:hypothetical protein
MSVEDQYVARMKTNVFYGILFVLLGSLFNRMVQGPGRESANSERLLAHTVNHHIDGGGQPQLTACGCDEMFSFTILDATT